jgi:tRNA threonylcarbamoyladenosine biosynthesis protein TsaB
MIVLGIDSATTGCSAAVLSGETVLAHAADAMTRGQAERLMPMIDEVLRAAGIGYAALDRIAVTVGPGAFTGVRIALAAARGLALGTGAATIGITTFDAVWHGLAPSERDGRRVLAAIDSRRAEPFLQLFDAGGASAGDAVMLDPAAVSGWLPQGPLLVAGDGAAALRPVLDGRPGLAFAEGSGLPDARVVARLGVIRAVGAPPQPAYLRAPDVSLPRGHQA